MYVKTYTLMFSFLMQAGRLYNLQSPVQREIAGSLVRQNSEIQDGGSRALNQVQGPSEWGPV